jgi:hypothetical protein
MTQVLTIRIGCWQQKVDDLRLRNTLQAAPSVEASDIAIGDIQKLDSAECADLQVQIEPLRGRVLEAATSKPTF